MEKNQEGFKSVVLNSNILFSSLIKEEGFTRAVLLFLKENKKLKFIIPRTVVKELKLHVGEIARKSKLTINDVLTGFEKLIENVKQVNELDLKKEIKEALKYVKDERDAPFVAAALKHRPSYILTYNKKDYKVKRLEGLNILVLNPKEALDLIGIERLELKTREKRRRNFFSYLTRLKFFVKK